MIVFADRGDMITLLALSGRGNRWMASGASNKPHFQVMQAPTKRLWHSHVPALASWSIKFKS